jgi:shikimate dehydrogenase
VKTYGLIGYPLSHSFSKKYFTEKFEKENIKGCKYELFPLENMEAFTELLQQQPDIVGLNVTIPYKNRILPFLDALDESAAAVGAVNTIKIENGRRIGFNTDTIGFKHSLQPIVDAKYGTGTNALPKALVLGTGGAAQAVLFVLKSMNIAAQTVSRKRGTNTISYEDLTPAVMSAHKLIINTTPLGMSPQTETFPEIPYDLLTQAHFLYDLVYNPEKTTFLKKGEQQGAGIKNGLEMLYLQAEAAWEIWNG